MSARAALLAILVLAGAAAAAGQAAPVREAARAPEPAHAALAAPTDLRADGALAAARGKPLVLLFSLPDCQYCAVVRTNYLAPLARAPREAERFDVRELTLNDAAPLTGFGGEITSAKALAARYKVHLAPAVVMLDRDGNLLVPPLLGGDVAGMYGAYLDRALDEARAVLAQAVSATSAAAAHPIALRAEQVSPHVYYFHGHTGMADAANQGFMSNAGFVVTPAGVVVFDALGTPALGAAMLKAIAAVTPQPVKRVIVSHYHADHFYGLQAFKAVGAEVWAHENGKLYLASDAAPSRLAQRRADLAPWVDTQTRLVAADRWLHFDAGKMIAFTLGGLHFRVIDTSGAHSADDIMLAVDDDQMLFAGDLFFTGRVPYVGEADSKVWLAALDNMLAIAPAVVVPGHGDMSRAPLRDLALTRSYLLFLRKSMGDAVADMLPFEDAYRNTDWSAFAAYPAFAQANRINAFQTYLLMERESLQPK